MEANSTTTAKVSAANSLQTVTLAPALRKKRRTSPARRRNRTASRDFLTLRHRGTMSPMLRGKCCPSQCSLHLPLRQRSRSDHRAPKPSVRRSRQPRKPSQLRELVRRLSLLRHRRTTPRLDRLLGQAQLRPRSLFQHLPERRRRRRHARRRNRCSRSLHLLVRRLALLLA